MPSTIAPHAEERPKGASRSTPDRDAAPAIGPDTVLDVRDLKTYFFLRRGIVKAVDGVSVSLRRGEVLGLVGESGCGKSLTALSIMRLLPRGGARTVGGEVRLNGEDILCRSPREMRAIRGSRISMILQDPQTSLNPVFTIGDQLREALMRRLGRRSKTDIVKEAVASLRHVEISAPEQRLGQFPHQMSGGMKQRVVGAIAMSGHPEVLIADEPTTALDVTIQLQYLKLLKRLQR
jgi:peptide/nickel transport system ATP-binding protein